MKNLETLSCDLTYSSLQVNGNPDWIREVAREKLTNQLGAALAKSNFIKETREASSVTYSARVIVATPDEFYRLVEEYANRRSLVNYVE